MNYAGPLLFVLFLFSTALTGHFWKYVGHGHNSQVRDRPSRPRFFISCDGAAAKCLAKQLRLQLWPHLPLVRAQDDGHKETAVAATFVTASPWVSEQCPHVRPLRIAPRLPGSYRHLADAEPTCAWNLQALNATGATPKPAACRADYPARSLADIRCAPWFYTARFCVRRCSAPS